MRICIDKRTNTVVNDFQSNPKEGSLIENAVRANLGSPKDFEEREVDDSVFEAERNKMIAQYASAIQASKNQRLMKYESIKNKLKKVGLTDDEILLIIKQD